MPSCWTDGCRREAAYEVKGPSIGTKGEDVRNMCDPCWQIFELGLEKRKPTVNRYVLSITEVPESEDVGGV